MTDTTPVLSFENYEGLQLQRLLQLKKKFTSEYGCAPSFVARAPGRVNLIGEHIDYCGYSVLPMAIEQDMLIACSKTDDKYIEIANLNPDFPSVKFDIVSVHIDKEKPNWFSYVLCGFVGVKEHFELKDLVGMKLCVDGNIPPSAGLSSSSALVCASALATLHANGLSMSKKDLAALCAHSEHFVGTEGGGMDQAISFLAEPGTAKLIEFNPLKTTDVQLPSGAVFVIANSCSDANKAATSDYNTRVVECRLATQIFAKKNGLNWKNYRKLGDVQVDLNIPLSKMPGVVSDVLHKEPYTIEEVCDILELTEDEFKISCLSTNTQHLKTFELYKRAMHVFTEANRVWEFKRICDEQPIRALLHLGILMNASHGSCRDLYECSHPNLDKLVDISLKAGAYGSRLTGAGWGGCTVSLVPSEKIESYLKTIEEKFYGQCKDRMKKISVNLFPTQPGRGAVIFEL